LPGIARHKDFLNDEQKKQFDNPQYAEVKAGKLFFIIHLLYMDQVLILQQNQEELLL
jgi:hypothetical protein